MTIKTYIEWISASIELLAAAVIVVAIVTAAAPRTWWGGDPGARRAELLGLYKRRIGKGMLLGLELMLAADILNTIAVQATIQSLGMLAVLALIRTFLSWSLEVEMEGCWPWQARAAERSTPREAMPPNGGAT